MERTQSVGDIKREYPLNRIKEIVSEFRKIKALILGDTIIDEYHFVSPKGRAIKDPILSVDYITHEVYAGGILAIANHVSNFVDQVTCVTLLGDREDRKEFINSALNKNVNFIYYTKKDSPTTIKKRYLNITRNEKLFKVEYINEQPISGDVERDIIDFLEHELPKYDLVLVGDFGHGFFTERIIMTLKKMAKFLSINVQSNSANMGFNFVTKYPTTNYVTMDLQELRYAVSDRFSQITELMNKLYEKSGFKRFLITMGKSGSWYFNNKSTYFFPSFVMRPQDTVGAGDAVFSITSLFAYCKYDDLIPFIANCVGGIAVSYIGNKEFITLQSLFNFIENTYNGNKQIQ